MTKQGAITPRMTSPDVCVADVNNFPIMERREGGRPPGSITSHQVSNKGQQCKQRCWCLHQVCRRSLKRPGRPPIRPARLHVLSISSDQVQVRCEGALASHRACTGSTAALMLLSVLRLCDAAGRNSGSSWAAPADLPPLEPSARCRWRQSVISSSVRELASSKRTNGRNPNDFRRRRRRTVASRVAFRSFCLSDRHFMIACDCCCN